MSRRREQELQRQVAQLARVVEAMAGQVAWLVQRERAKDAAAEVIARAQQDQGDADGDPWPAPVATAPVGRGTRHRAGSCLRRRHGRIVRRPAPGGGGR